MVGSSVSYAPLRKNAPGEVLEIETLEVAALIVDIVLAPDLAIGWNINPAIDLIRHGLDRRLVH